MLIIRHKFQLKEFFIPNRQNWFIRCFLLIMFLGVPTCSFAEISAIILSDSNEPIAVTLPKPTNLQRITQQATNLSDIDLNGGWVNVRYPQSSLRLNHSGSYYSFSGGYIDVITGKQGGSLSFHGEISGSSITCQMAITSKDGAFESSCNFTINDENHVTFSGNAGNVTFEAANNYFERASKISPTKNIGKDVGRNGCNGAVGNCSYGNPIHTGTGNKYEEQTDYIGTQLGLLEFTRYFNSSDTVSKGQIGSHWRHSYERFVDTSLLARNNSIILAREDGKAFTFKRSGTAWLPDEDVNYQLTGGTEQWIVTTPENNQEIFNSKGLLTKINHLGGLVEKLSYDAQGRLVTVSDSFGRKLTLIYNTDGNIATVTNPAGGIYKYGYNKKSNTLTSVTYPDKTSRTYQYENPKYPDRLTGITDEKGIRFATFAYNEVGYAISSQHVGGIDKITVSYEADGTASKITDALGRSRVVTFTNILGKTYNTSIAQPCAHCGDAGKTIDYDSRGNPLIYTDFKGNKTVYTYNNRNLTLSKTEAQGTSNARTSTIEWHPTFRLPIKITEPNRVTNLEYDSKGNLIKRTVTAGTESRIWIYQYNSFGLLAGVNEPRTDVSDITKYAYSSTGNLVTVTNELGYITKIIASDANGYPLKLQDANGLVTTFAYDSRGRLLSRNRGGEVTRYAYDPAGLLTKMTLPDSSFLKYRYDAAHRLTQIEDNIGNRVTYTLDKMSNLAKTETTDPKNILTYRHSQAFDTFGRLSQSLGAEGQATRFQYDANGNVSIITDPLGQVSRYGYDVLNRVSTSTDPLGKIIKTTYDANDNLVTVTDPRGLLTRYSYDGLGNQVKTVSPDTKTTQNSHDEAGNLISRTDTRGAKVTYRYDAQNRVITINYGVKPVITFTYDQGKNGIGHLTQMTDETGSTQWSYDAKGRVLGKTQKTSNSTLNTQYAYNAVGHMTAIRYPSGRTIRLGYTKGELTDMSLAGETATPLVGGIHYLPTGQIDSWVWGNGEPYVRDYDKNGRMSFYDLGKDRKRNLKFDAGGRIAQYVDGNPAFDQKFGYDKVGRLTAYTAPQIDHRFGYDANGNRVSFKYSAGGSTYTHAADSNQMMSIIGDNQKNYQYYEDGSVRTDNFTTYVYDDRGRLIKAGRKFGTEEYKINGLGQRVSKTTSFNIPPDSKTTNFVYDEAGHLIGEYGANGQPIQETVYLGDTPVAVFTAQGIHYIYADHLNAPRAIANSTGKIVWRWDSGPFGAIVANEDPDGDQKDFTYNLRFPGQYLDSFTGLHYNGFRDYEPSTGRYIQSDPIGLAGGINTYAYVNGNPISWVDPLGLDTAVVVGGWIFENPFGHVAIAFTGEGVYSYGTKEALGSSFTEYLKHQATYRDSTVFILKTTSEQEALMRQEIFKYNSKKLPNILDDFFGAVKDTCATRTQRSLEAGGITFPLLPFISPFPGDTGTVAWYNAKSYVDIPKNGDIPNALLEFDRKVLP